MLLQDAANMLGVSRQTMYATIKRFPGHYQKSGEGSRCVYSFTEEDVEYYREIRARYMKRGRVPGFSPKQKFIPQEVGPAVRDS